MMRFPPPVSVVRIPKKFGSFGYGAKLDGNIICLPHNPSVIKALDTSPLKVFPIIVSTMDRAEFNALPDYEDEPNDRD